MEIIGLDLHKRESHLSIRATDGSITDRRIATNRERFPTRDPVAPAPSTVRSPTACSGLMYCGVPSDSPV